MASFALLTYFPFCYHTILVNPDMLYADLLKAIFDHVHIDSNDGHMFLLEVFDTRYKCYVEFDDDYIAQLRQQLPRTSIESILARIVGRQKLCLLSRQSYFAHREKEIFPDFHQQSLTETIGCAPSYIIIWLDEHFAIPTNYRRIKRYLYTATHFEEPVNSSCLFDLDIDNLIRSDRNVDVSLADFGNYFKIFGDIDQCHHYITSRPKHLILFITSDRNARQILPSIDERTLNTYVLRDNWYDFEWGFDYIESLQMFDDDHCMLTRVVRDLARYFVDKASQVSPMEALIYLSRARKLYTQADQRSNYESIRYTSKRLQYIDHQLNQLETIVNTWNTDDVQSSVDTNN